MTTPRIEELENYKEPTQLNGTDYYRLPVNKLEYIIAQAHQAGRDEAVKKIEEAVSTIKVETTPHHRPDETLDWQADLINKHIMPAVRERFLAEIKTLQDNK